MRGYLCIDLSHVRVYKNTNVNRIFLFLIQIRMVEAKENTGTNEIMNPMKRR